MKLRKCHFINFNEIQASSKIFAKKCHDRPNRPETLEAEPEEEVDTDEKGPTYFTK